MIDIIHDNQVTTVKKLAMNNINEETKGGKTGTNVVADHE